MKSIFVVDDSKPHNIILEKMLKNCGYKVHTFTNSRKLLERFIIDKPNLIISDVNMPDLDGFELCKKVKKMPGGNAIPVIYISSMKKEEIEERQGVHCEECFIQKPLSRKFFLNEVAQAL